MAMYLVGFLFYLFFTFKRTRPKLAVFLLVNILFVAGLISYDKGLIGTDPHRVDVWKHAVEIWRPRSLTGHGHGAFKVMVQPQLPPKIQRDGHWAQAHNDYVQILFEQGLIGLGLFLTLMFITLRRFWETRVNLIPITSLVIFAGIMFWGFPLRTAIAVIPLISLVLFERT